MRVYVVTVGEYSDYHTEGIFSTREFAERFCSELIAIGDTPNIDEWVLNQRSNDRAMKVYVVTIDMQTGQVQELGSAVRVVDPRYTNTVSFQRWCGKELHTVKQIDSAVSLEHAIKVAVEARQAFLRELPVAG